MPDANGSLDSGPLIPGFGQRIARAKFHPCSRMGVGADRRYVHQFQWYQPPPCPPCRREPGHLSTFARNLPQCIKSPGKIRIGSAAISTCSQRPGGARTRSAAGDSACARLRVPPTLSWVSWPRPRGLQALAAALTWNLSTWICGRLTSPPMTGTNRTNYQPGITPPPLPPGLSVIWSAGLQSPPPLRLVGVHTIHSDIWLAAAPSTESPQQCGLCRGR